MGEEAVKELVREIIKSLIVDQHHPVHLVVLLLVLGVEVAVHVYVADVVHLRHLELAEFQNPHLFHNKVLVDVVEMGRVIINQEQMEKMVLREPVQPVREV